MCLCAPDIHFHDLLDSTQIGLKLKMGQIKWQRLNRASTYWYKINKISIRAVMNTRHFSGQLTPRWTTWWRSGWWIPGPNVLAAQPSSSNSLTASLNSHNEKKLHSRATAQLQQLFLQGCIVLHTSSMSLQRILKKHKLPEEATDSPRKVSRVTWQPFPSGLSARPDHRFLWPRWMSTCADWLHCFFLENAQNDLLNSAIPGTCLLI